MKHSPSLMSMIAARYPGVTFSFLLGDGQGLRLLIDCGPLVPDKLVSAQQDITSIDTIFISHIHGDHTAGLPVLLFGYYVELANSKNMAGRDIKLYAAYPVADQLRMIANQLYPTAIAGMQRKFSVRVNAINISKSPSVIQLSKNCTIRASLLDHTVPSLGMRIELSRPQISIAFSGDTRPCKEMLELAEDVDMLFHEALATSELESFAYEHGHSTSKDAGVIAKQANAKTLFLINYHYEYYGKEELLRKEAMEQFKGRVIIPQDLQVFNLGDFISQ